MKKLGIAYYLLPLALTAPILSSCSGTIAMAYSPSLVLKGKGPVAVEPLKYVPHEEKKVEANQMQNTAVGAIYLTEPVSKFITDALVKELAFTGYSIDPTSDRIVRGAIRQFMADDLGYSVDWSVALNLEVLTGPSKSVDYSGSCEANTKTSKGPGFAHGAVSQILRDCIEKFLKDVQAKRVL